MAENLHKAEIEINLEMDDIMNNYGTIVHLLDDKCNDLKMVQEQLPIRFLTKTGIKEHLSRISHSNTKLVDGLEKNRKELTERYQELSKKFKATESKEEKKKFFSEGEMLKKQIDNLKEQIEKFRKYSFDVNEERINYFYDDLVLFVSNCKHDSIDLHKISLTTTEDLKVEIDYIEAQLLLNVSEEYLASKGFTKITQDLRTAFVKSNKKFKSLKKILNKSMGILEAAKKLPFAFESDEVEYRRFSERKSKYN